MRKGVENAITALGIGFIENKNNNELRNKLRDGSLTTQEYYRQFAKNSIQAFIFIHCRRPGFTLSSQY